MTRGGARQGAGRKRKPIAKHKIDGTYRTDRHGERTTAADGVPLMPDDLAGRAAELWERLEPQLVAWGAGEIDSDCIAAMCLWWAAFREQYEAGEYNIAATCWDKFNSLAARYGLTIADREKLNIAERNSADDRESKFYGVVS